MVDEILHSREFGLANPGFGASKDDSGQCKLKRDTFISTGPSMHSAKVSFPSSSYARQANRPITGGLHIRHIGK